MALIKFNFSVALILLLFSFSAKAEINHSLVEIKYEVFDSAHYDTHFHFVGKNDNEETFEVISFSGFEIVSNIKLTTINDKGKIVTKLLKNLPAEDDLYSSFYSGQKFYKIAIEKGQAFELDYDIKCTLLMLLCRLPLNNSYDCNKIIHTVHLPKGWVFNFKINLADTAIVLNIDSVVGTTGATYTFAGTKLKPDKSKCDNYILCIVLPELAVQADYFNKWIVNLNQNQNQCSNQTKDEVFKNLTENANEEEIIKYISNVVREKVIYMDIEAGIGGWQPRMPNQVWNLRKGDCKDMANLMHHLLAFKNVESYMALVSANNMQEDFNFVTLGAANHAICVAKTKEGKWFFLDATDSYLPYNFPSRHTQGRKAFVIDNNAHAFFLDIPVIASSTNQVTNRITLHEETGVLNGTWEVSLQGISHYKMANLFHAANSENVIKDIKDYFTSRMPKATFIDYAIDSSTMDATKIKYHFSMPVNVISKNGAVSYLSLKGFPNPITQIYMRENDCYNYTDETILETFEIELQNLNSINKINSAPIEIKNECGIFLFSSTNSKTALKIKYTFELKKLAYRGDEINAYKTLQKKVNTQFNNFITYE